MGCGLSIACRDCKQVFYVGYGSYGTWYFGDLQVAKVQEWMTAQPKNAELRKNQNILKVVTEHDGHTLVECSESMFVKDGKLKLDRGGYAPDDIVIEDYGDYESVDLYSEKV